MARCGWWRAQNELSAFLLRWDDAEGTRQLMSKILRERERKRERVEDLNGIYANDELFLLAGTPESDRSRFGGGAVVTMAASRGVVQPFAQNYFTECLRVCVCAAFSGPKVLCKIISHALSHTRTPGTAAGGKDMAWLVYLTIYSIAGRNPRTYGRLESFWSNFCGFSPPQKKNLEYDHQTSQRAERVRLYKL